MIDIKYTLKENDFLELHLYYSKTQGQLRKMILKTLLVYLVVIVLLCGNFCYVKEFFAAIRFSLFAVLYLFFHQHCIKKIFVKCFKKDIKKYKSRFNKEVRLQVSDTQIQLKSFDGNTNLNLSQIDVISETGDYFLIKFKIEVVIIPKENLENVTDLQVNFIKLAESLNVKYVADLDWKW